MKKIAIILLSFAWISQGFTSFAGVSHSSFEWGDMDNDGDLDVLLTGAYETGSGWVRISKIYENQDGAFVDTQANLPVVFCGDSRWGDYDADNALSYNIYIKREDGFYYWSPNAIDNTGWMLKPDWGNVDLAEFDQHSQLNTIPNPARESIRLSTDEICKLSIRDIQGKLLWLQEKYQPQENIDVSFLKAGVYVLEVLDTKGLQMTKLMIE